MLLKVLQAPANGVVRKDEIALVRDDDLSSPPPP